MLRRNLYKVKRLLYRAAGARQLATFLDGNNVFLSRYLKHARAALAESYHASTRPLVSVVVPTYNLGKVLVERTIPSVLNQTYTNWEMIIYGDVCTDNTEELVKAIGDPRVKFYNLKEKLRLSDDEEFNRLHANGWKPYMCAIHEAAGQWIALFNDDDEFTPDHIEALLDHALKTDAELVYARQIAAYEDGTKAEIGREGFPDGKRPFFQDCVPQRTVFLRSYLKPFLFTKIDFIPKVNFAGDMVWWEQMGLAGVRASYLDKVVAVKHYGDKRAPASPVKEKSASAG